jgi:hypothetical protein
MHPQTVPQEAHAAFLRARQIVKANPSLAHSPASEAVSAANLPKEATFEATITSVHPDWTLILVGSLSKEAYKLELKELSPNFGDGRGQAAAAWCCDLTTSIPSSNLTPRMIFGNWL